VKWQRNGLVAGATSGAALAEIQRDGRAGTLELIAQTAAGATPQRGHELVKRDGNVEHVQPLRVK